MLGPQRTERRRVSRTEFVFSTSHDDCCVDRGGTEFAATGFCRVELYDVAERCWS